MKFENKINLGIYLIVVLSVVAVILAIHFSLRPSVVEIHSENGTILRFTSEWRPTFNDINHTVEKSEIIEPSK